MNAEQAHPNPGRNASLAQRIDVACDAFESAWLSGSKPSVASALEPFAPEEQSRALEELLISFWHLNMKDGDSPDLQNSLDQFPNHAPVVRSAWSRFQTDREKQPATQVPSGDTKHGVACRVCDCWIPNENDAPQGNQTTCPHCGAISSDALTKTDGVASNAIARLRHFELKERLGEGAFGIVWKARDTRLNRWVALKLPRKGQLTEKESRRFLKEAGAAAQLRHPNIVSVHEISAPPDPIHIVSEWIDGDSLDRQIENRPVPSSEAARLMVKLAEALHHAHECGVIHRDLKPQNILIDPRGEPHIADFGLAKWAPEGKSLSVEEAIMGTPAYMSPEQVRGDQVQLDRRSDIYALGVILYQLLTGKLPFEGDVYAILHKILHERPPHASDMAPSIPEELAYVCRRCMEKAPRNRYGSATELAAVLKDFLSNEENPRETSWKPEVGELVPRSQWKLLTQLGVGGFGEVWLARHEKLGQERVFKFCFQIGHARSLRREITLFRLLQKRTGDHPSIINIRDVSLDEPPYYLIMDYAAGKDLKAWCAERGGCETISEAEKVEIVAQVGEALQLAHDAGVIHRDVKPGNIIIETDPKTGNPRVKLTDFGIGQVIHQEILGDGTRSGFTQTLMSSQATQAGTHIYLAPEILAGDPGNPRSDIYSLGVVLYQFLINDFRRPLTSDWSKQISDPLLKDDLHHCLAGDPEERFAGPVQLTRHLRTLSERRTKVQEEEARLAKERHLAYRRGMVRTAAFASIVILGFLLLALFAFNQAREAQTQTKTAEEASYVTQIQLAASNLDRGNLSPAQDALRMAPSYLRNWEWGHLAARAWPTNDTEQTWTSVDRKPGIPDADYWRDADVRVIAKYQHPGKGSIDTTAITRQGNHVITMPNGGALHVWDIESSRQVDQMDGIGYTSICLTLDHEDSRLAYSSMPDVITLIDWKTKSITWSNHTPDGKPTSDIWFSPDNKYLLTASFGGAIFVWRTENGEQVSTFSNHTRIVSSVRFSETTAMVRSASLDGTIQYWNLLTGESPGETHRAPVPPNADVAVQEISPDGGKVATGLFDGSIIVWDLATGQQRPFANLNGEIKDILYSEDGSALFVVEEERWVRVFDSVSREQLCIFEAPKTVRPAVFLSPGSTRVVTSSAGDGISRVWAPVQQAPHQQETLDKAHQDYILLTAFSPDSRRIVTASYDTSIKVWDVDSETLLTHFTAHEQPVLTACFSPDGEWIASFSVHGKTRVWNASTGEERFSLDASSGEFFRSVTSERGLRGNVLNFTSSFASNPFIPGRNDLVIFQDSQMMRMDGNTGKEQFPFLNTPSIGWPIFDSGGKWMTIITDMQKNVHVWDLSSGEKKFELNGHTAIYFSASFNKDGSRLVTSGSDHYAIVWNLNSGREWKRLEGHEGIITQSVFNQDGTWIATCSHDRTVRVWDANTGEQLSLFSGHAERVSGVIFSPDGSRLLSTSLDETVRVWIPDQPVARELLRLEGTSKLLYATWSPDGKTIASCWTDGSVRLFKSIPWNTDDNNPSGFADVSQP